MTPQALGVKGFPGQLCVQLIKEAFSAIASTVSKIDISLKHINIRRFALNLNTEE